MRSRKALAATLVAMLVNPGLIGAAGAPQTVDPDRAQPRRIKHLVVIFDENISFDHYFATYPNATNPPGEPVFHARPGTPTVNGLQGALLTNNPNSSTDANGADATNPFRLDRSQAWTASQNHDYMPEQLAVHNGLMDLFPSKVGTADSNAMLPSGLTATKGLTMGYFDGNTVTAMWNYAQHFAMSDNAYGTGFGPSTPGALNLISGQTNGISTVINGTGEETDGSQGSLTMFGDADPYLDKCSSSSGNQAEMKGKNIGDLLNAAGISWGWFQGGFDLTRQNTNGTTDCARSSVSPTIAAVSPTSATIVDYVPHHQPFQYYPSTRNPQHARPSSVHSIGLDGDAGNHQYDIEDFYAAIRAGNFPTVSFLKAAKYQNAHASNSTPLDEQAWVVHVLNFLQQRPEWNDTAVVIAYDDSDGWYDHQMAPIVNQSNSPVDALSGPNQCGPNGPTTALPGPDGVAHAQGRCGYGPRLPMLVISPWAKKNFVDHTLLDQTSIIRFVEDYWLKGERVGDGSFDAIANSIDNMFDFNGHDGPGDRNGSDLLLLDENSGQPLKLR